MIFLSIEAGFLFDMKCKTTAVPSMVKNYFFQTILFLQCPNLLILNSEYLFSIICRNNIVILKLGLILAFKKINLKSTTRWCYIH